jgi:quercetin dioxygenase-like cupin family protein
MTVYKTNGMRIVLIALHEDAVLKKHIADGIISVQILEGEIIFSTDGQSVVIKKGQMIALHKGLPHSIKAIKESVFLLTLTTSLES